MVAVLFVFQGGVGVQAGRAGHGVQVAETLGVHAGLVDDHALAPTLGVVQGVLMLRPVPAAAVVQVEDQIHLRLQQNAFQAHDQGVFRVCGGQGRELAVHIPVGAAVTLQNAGKVEIRHHPDFAAGDAVVRGQKGRR